MTLQKSEAIELLNRLGAELDIPEDIYEEAIVKYEDIGTWLSADDSALKSYEPQIYPQGSFRLGTAIRPISSQGEYDIDLVCHLIIPKERVTQEELKKMVGDRLKQRQDLAKVIKPSRRCWRLNFPEQFHMDVLPVIPNQERLPNGVLLTDTELIRWQKSNPKAYADWFYSCMRLVFEQNRLQKAKSIDADIEDVPEWQIRTPLQRAVQILKRHRDMHFSKTPEICPVSIIITTLAAKAYKNQVNIVDALSDIVTDMPSFIENRNGRWWVENPVEPDENFADKWNESPERRMAFLSWLNKVQRDFNEALQKRGLKEVGDSFGRVVGETELRKALQDMGIVSTLSNTSSSLKKSIQVPELGDANHSRFPVWPVVNQYKATISATVYSQNYKRLWPLTDRPVSKYMRILFRVKTNTPLPFEVKWQIVNTGNEAVSAGQLRGEFYESEEGSFERWERTLYRGTHWVEAFVIKDGICVARSGRKYVKVR